MIYYESQVSDSMRQILHELSGAGVVTKEMNVVCPNDHLAMRNASAIPESVHCPLCDKSYDRVNVFTQFTGPTVAELKEIVRANV